MSSDQESGSLAGAVKVLAVVVLLVVASVVGAVAFGVVGTPSVVSSESRFADVNESTTTIRTDVAVENPNPIAIDRERATVSHTVRLNDLVVANGTRRGLTLPPGESTRSITTYMENGRIPEWWVSHVENDERTVVEVDAWVYSPLLGESIAVPRRQVVETDVLADFDSTETRPVNADVPFRDSPVLYVNRTSARWGPVSEGETPINATFEVYNPLPVPVPITELGYTVSMNGVRVGNGTTERARVLNAGQVTEVNTAVGIDATRLDEWWVTHLRREQNSTVRVEFSLQADLPVVGTIRLPVDDLTYRTSVETDLLGTKDPTGQDPMGPTSANASTGANADAGTKDETDADPSAEVVPASDTKRRVPDAIGPLVSAEPLVPAGPFAPIVSAYSAVQFHFRSAVYARSYVRSSSN